MVFEHLDHQAVYGPANRRYNLQNVVAGTFRLEGALDCLDLSANPTNAL
jgi:hypothetical protein